MYRAGGPAGLRRGLSPGVPQSGPPGPSEAKGILLALCSAALYAGVILINKYLAGVPAYDRTLLQLAGAAAVMIPYILLTEDLSAMSVTPLGAVLLLIGVFLTFFRKSGLWPLGTAAYLTVRLLMLARRTDAVQ